MRAITTAKSNLQSFTKQEIGPAHTPLNLLDQLLENYDDPDQIPDPDGMGGRHGLSPELLRPFRPHSAAYRYSVRSRIRYH